MDNSSVQERDRTLAAERSVNEEYLRRVKELLRRQPNVIEHVAIARSQAWTSSGLPRPAIDGGAASPVIGRVALCDDHPYAGLLREDFYITGWRVETPEFETVNWAAPVASIYFEGNGSDHELALSVQARRTFVAQHDDLIDFHDEVHGARGSPFTRHVRKLEVPSAPTRRARPSQRTYRDQQRGEPPAPHADGEAPKPRSTAATPRVTVAPPEARRAPAIPQRTATLRAAPAVAQVISMPKTGRMGAVLPTMQPEQYRFVSWPADVPLIVQGQPGTGKTVIAAHRAVFLTSQERGSDRVAHVGLIGPTDQYVEHVSPIVAELKEPDADIRVFSLPALLRDLTGQSSLPKGGPGGRIESSWELGRAIERFVKSRPSSFPPGRRLDRVRSVVEALRTSDLAVVGDREIEAWFRALPRWSEVSAQARYVPMLASISLALEPRRPGDRVHLIVDEAQDVRPIEWRILVRSLLGPEGGLTLLGDMNQRRSDWTAGSWKQLARELDLTDDDGVSHIQTLESGFRSTRPILQFANQLLPRGARDEQALRDGPVPVVSRVPATQTVSVAVDAAIELAQRHEGLVALLSMDPVRLSAEFRRRGWARGRFQHSWARNGKTILVLHPDGARGLEFDGVVVVEPAAFPENVGRQGVLYTSLTRANNELVVVHSRPLPRDLRPPRSR